MRKIKGAELNALAQASDEAANEGGFGAIIGPCWVETLDTGPYTSNIVCLGSDKPNWNRLLKGDLLYAFVHLRRLSMPDGDTYDFDVQCEECKDTYGWTLKLSNLPVQKLSDESKKRMQAQKRFEARLLSDNRRIAFDLQTVAQEEEIAKLMKQQKRERATLIDVLAAQAVEIEGINPDIRARWRFLTDLDMDDLLDLQSKFEEADCGLDTAIKTRCTKTKCRWVQEVNLPLGKRFFSRRRKFSTDEPEKPEEAVDISDSYVRVSAESLASTSGLSAPNSGGINTAGAGTEG